MPTEEIAQQLTLSTMPEAVKAGLLERIKLVRIYISGDDPQMYGVFMHVLDGYMYAVKAYQDLSNEQFCGIRNALAGEWADKHMKGGEANERE